MKYPNSFKHYCHGKLGLAIASILLLLICFSCNRSGKPDGNNSKYADAFSSAKKQALVFSTSNNDSAITYADAAIKLMHKMDFNNSDTLFSLLEIKANAYQSKNNMDSVLSILAQAYTEAEEKSDVSMQAKTALLIGSIAQEKDNMYIAKKYLPIAINLLDNQNNEYKKAQAYNCYGQLLESEGNYKKAIEFLMKAFKIFEKLNKFSDLSSVSLNIGNNFNAINSKKQELNFSRTAMDAALKANDTLSLMNSLINLGVYYRSINPDSAIFYYNKVVALKPKSASSKLKLMAIYNIANIALDRKDYKEAMREFNNVLTASQLAKHHMGIAYAYSGIATVYSTIKNNTMAIEYLKKAISIADSIGETRLVMSFKFSLEVIYEENANYKEAHLLAKEITVFNDSSKSAEKQIAIHEMEANYQSEKKELENKILKTELKHTNKLLISRYVIIFVLFIITLILGLFIWRINELYKQRKMAYDVLMKQYKLESELRNENKGEVTVIKESPSETKNTTNEMELPNDSNAILMKQLSEYYETLQPFLNPDFRVEDAAEFLKCTRKNIASSLRENDYSNFASFTNEYRVEHAKKLMQLTEYRNYKTEELGFMAGFGSKQNFYMVFRQVTGLQPSYFHQNITDLPESIV